MKKLLTSSVRSVCQIQNRSKSDIATKPELRNNSKFDAIIIGGGHNGLVAASYLAKCGQKVCILERRHIVGGAAVTEEIIPGFKFSRASYLLSLLRPVIMEQLELKKHGLKYHLKNPNSFTPLESNKYLFLGRDGSENRKQIAQYSSKDAEAYEHYELWLHRLSKVVDELLDVEPPNLNFERLSVRQKLYRFREFRKLGKILKPLGVKGMLDMYELTTAPINKVLDRWFESEPLKATLATDGVVGAMVGPRTAGSGYVLLHHVMGELDGKQGAWAIVYGGMGAVSEALAKSALSYGVEIYTEKEVSKILLDNQTVKGVTLSDGSEIYANVVLSNATPHVTFSKLLSQSSLPNEFRNAINTIDYTSPVTKINVAVNKLPSFSCLPSNDRPMPQHQCSSHLNVESMDMLQQGYADAQSGRWSSRPLIEMTIPSSVDSTISPTGCHVVLLFTQFTPYTLANGKTWDEPTRKQYAEHAFDNVERYCPGFRKSIVGYECLPPPELERIFGLTGGNIFHGSMSLDQLYFARPTARHANYRTPLKNLYLCGSGAHPGGGVMGAPGRMAALAVLNDYGVKTSNLKSINNKR